MSNSIKLKVGKVHQEFSRDMYWFRIYVESTASNKQSVIVACASHEYLRDRFGNRDIGSSELSNWREEVIKKWQEVGGKVLENNRWNDVYATTPEGEANGRRFLEDKISS